MTECASFVASLLAKRGYDVQSAEPVSAWTTPPFEPSSRNGALFARGVIDDKGEIIARLAAIDALLDSRIAARAGVGRTLLTRHM